MPDNLDPLVVNLPAPLTVSTIESVTLPEAQDIDAVTVTLATAPAGSTAAFDVLVAGSSIFATAIGTVRNAPNAQGTTQTGMGTGDTSLTLTPSAAGFEPRKGQVITVDSEDMVVTSESGSYQTQGGSPEYTLTITRAANGTTAATHAAGASVLPAKPKVVAGQTSSSGVYAPALTLAPTDPSGAVLALTCTAIGSGTAGGGGTAVLELGQR